MKTSAKIFVILWFIGTWLALIALTLKPIGVTNTLWSIAMPLVRNLSAETETVLCSFDNPRDFSRWYWQNITMEPSREHVSKGEYSAEVRYLGKHDIAGLVAENYNIGPLGVKDWSPYGYLRAYVYNPQPEPLSLHLKVKDRAGREVDRIVELKAGQNGIVVDLDDLGQFLDLANIVYVNFYIVGLREDRMLYFDDIRLERADPKRKRMGDEPILTLVNVSCPKEVRGGEELSLSLLFSLAQEISHDYQVFIHVMKADELRSRAKRTWYVNADQAPWTPTSQWKARTPYEIGPLRIFIPKRYPPGEYAIQAGLFNPSSQGGTYRFSANRGMTDFSSGYPRLKYTDARIKDYVVGRIEVR